MDYATILFGIALVQLLGAASPGPTFMVVTSHAIGGSRRSGLLVVCGVLLASLAWALLAALGLAAFIARFPTVYTVLQLAGAAYLIWLGARMLAGAVRRGAEPAGPVRTAAVSGWRVVRAGFLTNMTNPKSAAYYTSIFVVMIPAEAPGWLFIAAVCVALLVSATWWVAVACLFSVPRAQRAYARARRAIDAVMGGVLIALGARLVLSR
jgi:threonine efflux protein